MKILIIEDDKVLADNIKHKLEKSLFVVDTAHLADDGVFQAQEFSYDCIILDINLPDKSGFEVCKSLREGKISTPILIMTARDDIGDKIKGLNLGADDYITKPIDSGELIARIRALIRRSKTNSSPSLKIGNLIINPQTRRVKIGSKQIKLSSKEFSVLEYLAHHSDEVVTRTMLMEHVWGSDFETLSNVIDVYIKNLRQKIDTKGRKKLIHTIRGSGYSLSNKR